MLSLCVYALSGTLDADQVARFETFESNRPIWAQLRRVIHSLVILLQRSRRWKGCLDAKADFAVELLVLSLFVPSFIRFDDVRYFRHYYVAHVLVSHSHLPIVLERSIHVHTSEIIRCFIRIDAPVTLRAVVSMLYRYMMGTTGASVSC